jgi:undecaprenyl-diphosphatase
MNWLESLVSGIIQGLTEFLPVSSSGHLTIAGTFFGLTGEENLAFAILVHIATVLSTILVLWKDIAGLCKGLFAFRWNSETQMVAKLILSMIPVGFVGLFFRDTVEVFFGSGLLLVGCMLLLTAALLLISSYAVLRPKTDVEGRKDNVSFRDAMIIGLVQAAAVLPGLSRSGATIATGVWLGNDREKIAKFSFLMVIIPVLGETLLDGMKMLKGETSIFTSLSVPAMICGFTAAFVSGLIACKWMIGLVKKGKMNYFAYYCVVLGLFVICYSLIKS